MNIRPVTTTDIENCGRVIYKAFCGIADRHNFPHDFPSLDAAMGMADMTVNNPNVDGFVAEDDGRFLGSNFLWRHNAIAGVGPITIDPDAQAKGVGRKLMQAVIERGRDAEGIRLVQDAFNTTSMSLYASLGINVVGPLVMVQGTPAEESPSAEMEVRPLEEKDFQPCAELCRKVHGFDRNNELREIAEMSPAFVAVRGNRIVAYAAAPVFWQMNHAVAESTEDMQSLLSGAARLAGQSLAFLLPTRHAEIFRWCLSQGLRVVKPMTLMAMGEYQQPRGCFIPSVLY